jgi:hypothetical protein
MSLEDSLGLLKERLVDVHRTNERLDDIQHAIDDLRKSVRKDAVIDAAKVVARAWDLHGTVSELDIVALTLAVKKLEP